MSKRRRKPVAALNARNADPHALYEIAVQQPQVIIGLIEEMFEQARDREPVTLREDFCGTANLSALWVRSSDGRSAVAIDNDAAVLAWADQHNRRPLVDRGAKRLRLLNRDVLAASHRADVVVSLNFSHFIYKTRDELLTYLRHARRCTRPGGVFLCDAFGGPESISPCLDRRRFSDFDYLWEQRSYDPLTNAIDCRIHFTFRNGTRLSNAFIYDWRMWTLPELREALLDVGFDDVGIYFESEEGFIADADAVDDAAWVAYLVALRD